MRVPAHDGSFSFSVRPRHGSNLAQEDIGVSENNGISAQPSLKSGCFSSNEDICSYSVAKYLVRGCILTLCVLAGFALGAFYGPGNYDVKSPDRQFVPVYDISYHNWPHERRLSVSGTDDGAGEGSDRPADEDKGDPTKSGQGLPLDGKDGDKDQPPSVPETEPPATSPADVTDPAEQSGQTETATAPPRDADKTAAQQGTSQAKQKRRRRRADASNGPNPYTYREHLCSMIRSDPMLQEWYALVVLYAAEWPTYARHGNGGDAYIEYLRDLAKNLEVPKHGSSQVRALVTEELSCGTPSFFLNGLDVVAKDIHKHHDLIMVLRKYREQSDFTDVIDYTQVTKLPADASISGFPMILRIALEGFIFCFSRDLYIKPPKDPKDPKGAKRARSSGALTMSGMYNSCVKQYQHSQFQYWLLLMMASVMKRIVSSRPHAGIMVLKFDSAQALGMSRRGRAMHDLDKAAIDSLQRQVAASVEGKLDRSVLRFQNFQFVQSPPTPATSAQRPTVSVTGYLERTQAGTFVDHGIFGMDMETDTLEELKERMEPGNLLVDVSLVDPWSSWPPSEWPDPLQRDVLALTAYTATQLLCAELQWDPSLGNLGHVEVVYSGFTDVYDAVGGAQQPRAKFDPDVQVLLLRDNQKFAEDGLEEGSKKKITNLLAQEPLQWGKKRVIDAERILWRGIAMPLRGGQMYRKNAFGMGLPPALRRCAEELLKPNVVLIHIAIRGLGHLTPDTLGFDMTASEMASRLVRRSRGIYDAVLVKSEAPVVKDLQVKGEQKCVGEMPKWVVLVASLSVALFFIILITLLLYHDKIKLPWWIMCICSSRAPWEESPSVSSISHDFPPEGLEKQSNSTRDIIALAPPLKEMTTSM